MTLNCILLTRTNETHKHKYVRNICTCVLKSICFDEIKYANDCIKPGRKSEDKKMYRYLRVGGDREWGISGEAAFRYAMICILIF